jgi:hypothetical protein
MWLLFENKLNFSQISALTQSNNINFELFKKKIIYISRGFDSFVTLKTIP